MRGSGPPLLWISGYVVPSQAFDAVIDGLADGFRVIAVDHRGSGHSSAPWCPTTTATMAADTLSVLDHLGISAAHVVGFSLGGMVAQELAIRSPQRVRSLVLGCTSAGGHGAKAPPAGELLGELRRTAGRIPGKVHVGVLAAVRQGWAASTHDTTRRLGRIKAPTLVLHGSADTVVPVANAAWLAGRIPTSELRVVTGSGHLLVLESPTARRALRGWLDEHLDVAAAPPPDAVMLAEDLTAAPYRLLVAQTLPVRRLLRAGSRLVR